MRSITPSLASAPADAGIADSLGRLGHGVRQLTRNLQRYVDAHNVELGRRSGLV